jgi:hypothetical protein
MMKHMLEKLVGSSVDLAGLAHEEFGIDDSCRGLLDCWGSCAATNSAEARAAAAD